MTARLSGRRAALLVLALGLALGLLAGGWMWLRDSSLVVIQRVRVTGATGPDAAQIRAALTTSARGMTTLDVRMGALRAAVSAYPLVKQLRVSTQFPHGIRIAVIEQVPVAAANLGGRPVAVAADGTLLRDLTDAGPLPLLTLKAAPGGTRIDDPAALAQLRVLAAAPAALLPRISAASNGYWHGVVLTLHNGPRLFFGDPSRVMAKWQAVLAVLATKATTGADYVDVSDPQRAAAGLDSLPASMTAGPGTAGG